MGFLFLLCAHKATEQAHKAIEQTHKQNVTDTDTRTYTLTQTYALLSFCQYIILAAYVQINKKKIVWGTCLHYFI